MIQKRIIQDHILFPEIMWSLPQNIYKSSRGSVLVVAGSKGMAGAGALAAEGAFRIGSGLVTLAHPDSLSDVYDKLLPETMTLPLPSTPSGALAKESASIVLEKLSTFDSLVIGPGLSNNTETLTAVEKIIKESSIPTLIDASALKVFENNSSLIYKNQILTPHPGEMMSIIKGIKKHQPESFKKIKGSQDIAKNKAAAAAEFSGIFGDVVLVLKGDNTVISSGETLIINKTGNPGMAKAGMGDVLSGVIGGLSAQNQNKPLEAAATGVYLHSLAGDLAEKSIGERSITASDILKFLPQAIKASESD